MVGEIEVGDRESVDGQGGNGLGAGKYKVTQEKG